MKIIIRTVFICLIVSIPTGIYCQVKTEDESILQMLKQQTWKINHDLTTLKKGDSTFMWSNYGDKDIWKYLNKKEYQIIDGDFRFADNGKILQVQTNKLVKRSKNNEGSKKEIIWNELGSYYVNNSNLRILLGEKIIELKCEILSNSFINLKPVIDDKQLFLGSILTDSVFEEQNLSSKFGLEHIFKSKNIIEIRLYSNLAEAKNECVILQYSDSLKWMARKCTNRKEQSKVSSENSGYKKNNLDSVFKQLTSNNIFSLPSQNKINQTQFYLNPETKEISLLDLSVSDGICYFVEFKILNDFRQYKYCNPQAFLNSLPNKSEYKYFVEILTIFNGLTK